MGVAIEPITADVSIDHSLDLLVTRKWWLDPEISKTCKELECYRLSANNDRSEEGISARESL